MDISRERIYDGSGKGAPRTQFDYKNTMPDDMVAWFRDRENPVTYAEDKAGRVTPKGGEVPTFSGYASKLGVPKKTLEGWTKGHKGFKVAWDWCKEIGVAACYKILAEVPGSFKGIEMILKYEFGVGMDGGNSEMAPIVLCGVGQKPDELIEEIIADEEPESSENNEEEPKEAANDSVEG